MTKNLSNSQFFNLIYYPIGFLELFNESMLATILFYKFFQLYFYINHQLTIFNKMYQKEVKLNGHKLVGNYLIQRKIGRGSFSEVFQGFDLKNKKPVAIKIIKSETVQKIPSIKNGVIHEVQSLSLTKHCPYIINLIDFIRTENNYYLVYQLCSDGTLEDIIKRQGFLNEEIAIKFLKQIIQGFKVLNKLNIIHRDIKPANILIEKGKIKIADFGLCMKLFNKSDLMQSTVGTLSYQAPEIIIGDKYSQKCDIYSLGILLYKMLFGSCPFTGQCAIDMIYKFEQHKLNIQDSKNISQKTKFILKRMIQKDEQKRADWNEIFNFFSKYYSDQNDTQQNKQNAVKYQNKSQIYEGWSKNATFNKRVSQSETETTQTRDNEQQLNKKSINYEQLYELQQIMTIHQNIINITDIVVKIRQDPLLTLGQSFLMMCINQVEQMLKEIRFRCNNNQSLKQIQALIINNLQLLDSLRFEVQNQSQNRGKNNSNWYKSHKKQRKLSKVHKIINPISSLKLNRSFQR